MKTVTIIGGKYAGIWGMSISDISKGFFFVKSLPFSEMTNVKKKKTVEDEVFVDITLSDGTRFEAKMHVNVYPIFNSSYLDNRNKDKGIALPLSTISGRDAVLSGILFLFLYSLVEGDLRSVNQPQANNQPPATQVSSKEKPRDGLKSIPDLFQKPYKYISMPVRLASEKLGVKKNQGGNLVVDTQDLHILFEANNGLISYVDVEFNGTGPCSQTAGFDSEPLLRKLGIDPKSLELSKKQAHYHRYYDHNNRLKISVACHYDEANLSVGFSSKYYLQ
jgi:hypothetical protein